MVKPLFLEGLSGFSQVLRPPQVLQHAEGGEVGGEVQLIAICKSATPLLDATKSYILDL